MQQEVKITGIDVDFEDLFSFLLKFHFAWLLSVLAAGIFLAAPVLLLYFIFGT